MEYLKSPLEFINTPQALWLRRPVYDKLDMLDNLVELVVFTPRGSFDSDPDFGFEYWNHEYSNVRFREFNNGQSIQGSGVSKQECEESVRRSLLSYAPFLEQINVAMELNALTRSEQARRRTVSKYEVIVRVEGSLDYGLNTERPYIKVIRFLMEPMAKKVII